MTSRWIQRRALPGLTIGLVLAGCGEDSMQNPPPGTRVSDFSIVDVNQTSPRFDAAVSPRDYLGQVSAWYFGHAT